MQKSRPSRVLVAVADRVLGAQIKGELERQGNLVLGPFRSVKDTIPFSLDRELQGALVEDWLVDGPTTQIVDALSRRGIAVGTFSTRAGAAVDPGLVELAEICRGVNGFISKLRERSSGHREANLQSAGELSAHHRYLGVLKGVHFGGS
jgi:hypothetical protein